MRNAVVFALVALCLLPPAVPAQSSALGPGPFTNIRLTAKGDLLFTVRNGGGKTVAFSGTPRVSVSENVDFVPVDGRAVVRKNGRQLLQKGTVGGVPLADYFVEGEQRRIAVRNGDGVTTEVDVVRQGDGFLIPYTARSPRATSRRVAFTSRENVSARSDISLELRAETELEGDHVEAVVAVTLPPLPEGTDLETIYVEAINVETSEHYGSEIGFVATSPVVFLHVVVPEGAYELVLHRYLTFGNPEISAGLIVTSTPIEAPVTITRRDRIHGITAPDLEIPEFRELRVTIEGLDQLSPSTSNRVDVELSISGHGNVSYLVQASRSVSTPGPLTFDVRLPDADLTAYLSVGRGESGDNASSTSTSIPLGEIVDDDHVTFLLPELVRITGALLDPEFVLATAPGTSGIPRHHIHVDGIFGSSNYSSTGTLSGFARGYELFVPRGTTGSLSAQLSVSIGEPAESSRENDTGTLRLSRISAANFGDGLRLDVTVPSLEQYVTVTGALVDTGGNRIKSGFVIADGGGALRFTTTVQVKDGAFRMRLPPGTYTFRATAYDL